MESPTITKYLKLPLLFDTSKLNEDLLKAADLAWTPHFNRAEYDGQWNVISLYSASGNESDIHALAIGKQQLTETSLLKKCHYFREVINSFKTEILSARILKLKAGASIKPHRDHALGYEDGNFRIHVPITTNPDVSFILDGTKLAMMPGECWYTNVNYVHSVVNSGNTDRDHLVIDAQRNDWSDQLFFSLAHPESFRAEQAVTESPETLKRMIEELSLHNNPAAETLIAELKQKLKNSKR